MVYKYPRVCWIVSVRRFEVSSLSLMRFLCDPISVSTACSRFTVRIPGKCLSLAWTPAAPSDFMQKDNWSLSRCAQVLMRYVHGSFGLLFQEHFITWNIICVRPDLNLFCPFFLQNKKMIKLIWRNYSTLHCLLLLVLVHLLSPTGCVSICRDISHVYIWRRKNTGGSESKHAHAQRHLPTEEDPTGKSRYKQQHGWVCSIVNIKRSSLPWWRSFTEFST